MKALLPLFALIFLITVSTQAQSGRQVHGRIIDSTKLSLPGSTITITSDQHDSTSTIADLNGKFVFASLKGQKLPLPFHQSATSP